LHPYENSISSYARLLRRTMRCNPGSARAAPFPTAASSI
jgi:hypothetical protein